MVQFFIAILIIVLNYKKLKKLFSFTSTSENISYVLMLLVLLTYITLPLVLLFFMCAHLFNF